MLKRKKLDITANDIALWKQRAYHLCRSFSHAAIIDSNGFEGENTWTQGPFMAGFGVHKSCEEGPGFFERWKNFSQQIELPALGYLSYDLKNQVEKLSSANFDGIGAPEAFFFEPLHFLEIKQQEIWLCSFSDLDVFEMNLCKEIPATVPSIFKGEIKCRMPEQEYRKKVEEIREHIRSGNVYEMNLCVEFFSENALFDPYQAALKLREISPAPFAVFLKMNHHYLCSASPERFLKKTGNRLVSQPIKGTRRRGADKETDRKLKEELLHSEKDRAENVMIVDLVRNDLARSCIPGSVRVDELFGIYSFPQVHQMISTVSGTLEYEKLWTAAVQAAFPMGSMTGAPKVMAMRLIEEFENSRRGVYSGAAGYVLPGGDFDFNVVIRSLLYNEKDSYLSYHSGGAITYDSRAEDEWDEIMVKASGIFRLLGVQIIHKT